MYAMPETLPDVLCVLPWRTGMDKVRVPERPSHFARGQVRGDLHLRGHVCLRGGIGKNGRASRMAGDMSRFLLEE